MKKGIIVLSLFDGMSCGRIAFDRAGIKVKKYYASEIDKYAQIVSEKNYPDIVRLGDITKWREWKIEKPDMIIGGSPCQGFSFAGKGLNFDDPRSKLFFTFADILKHYKPQYFLLENVRMKKEYQKVISDCLGVEPIEINSALVSAQNRKRLYWTNIRGVTQPEDKGILLKDIIENATADKDKSYCLDSNYYKGSSVENYIDKSRLQMVECGAIRGRNPDKPTSRESGLDTVQMLEIRDDGKTNCLTSVQKDNVIVLCHENKSGNRSMHTKKSCALRANASANYQTVKSDAITWRKLTPIECERLQTVPDNYTNHVSNSQRYKMLGNGWTVDVIAHIFRGLK